MSEVDVFVASNMPTGYPRKLQKPSTVTPKVRDSAETFILDSGIGEDVSTDDLLSLADRFDPDFVVAKDVLHDHEATTANILDIVDRDHPGDLLVPLQPPYDEHYLTLADHGIEDAKYVLGGMSLPDVGHAERLRWIRSFREVAPDVFAHALGVGGGIEFVEAVAGTGLIDSLDCATPEMAAINGSVLDHRLRQDHVLTFPGGEGRNRRTYPLAEFNSWQLRDVWRREADGGSDLSAYL